MVVDYRKVNSRTVRSTFLIPRGDDQKQRVAAARLISMLDAVSGFNHVPNTRRARKALAMITLSGVYLPVCLPFGPLNGPEVFQRLMHDIFQARLLKEWFIYLDDLAVATFSRGPRAATSGEEAAAGKSRAAGLSGRYKFVGRIPKPFRSSSSVWALELDRGLIGQLALRVH